MDENVGVTAERVSTREKRLWFRSIVGGMLAAIAYGVVHDQITIRISPPYLMDWHPEIVPSRDPTVVALAWGVVATWWFGLILGAVLAGAATLGRLPRAPGRWIVRSMAAVFVAAALAAACAGGIARLIELELPDSLFGSVYRGMSRHGRIAFSQAAAIHEASYDAAGVATAAAAVAIVVGRRRLARAALTDG